MASSKDILFDIARRLMPDNEAPPLKIAGVEASAGSGKTYLLTTLYIFLSLLGELTGEFGFQNILAITFTNEAADEMKRRVFSRLRRMALFKYGKNIEKEGPESTDLEVLSELLRIDIRQVSELSEKVYENMLDDFSSIAIKTIDSFMNSLMGGLAYELSIPPDSKVALREDPYIEEALARLLAERSTDPSFWEELRDSITKLEALHGGLSWNPFDYLKKTMIDIHRKLSVERFSNSAEIDAHKIKKAVEHLIACGKSVLSSLFSVLKEPVRKILPKLEEALSRGVEIVNLSEIIKEFLESKIRLSNTGRSVLVKTALERNAIKDVDDLKFLKAFSEFAYVFSLAYYNSVFHLYEQVNNSLKRIKMEKGIRFLSDLRDYLSKLSSAHQDIELALPYWKICDLYRFILIDEFQDTDLKQWDALKPIIREAVSLAGPSLFFYVGDKKQAIYRWKGGKVELFNNILYELFEQDYFRWRPHFAKYVMEINYRSAQKIVEFFNKVFSSDNLERFEEKDVILKFYDNSLQEAARDFPGVVDIKIVEKENFEEKVKGLLLHEIEKSLNEHPRWTVAVLVRSNERVHQINSWLAERGLPFSSKASMLLRESPAVECVVNFLNYLCNPDQDFYLVYVFMSEFFPLKISEAQKADVVKKFTDMKGKNFLKFLKESFPDASLFEKIEGLRSCVHLLSPYDAVVEASRVLNFYPFSSEKLCGEESFLKQFFEVALRFQSENPFPDVRSFLGWWADIKGTEEDPVLPTPPNFEKGRVYVGTIHSAKGLEYQHVILPFVDVQFRRGIKNMFVEKELYYINGNLSVINQTLAEIYKTEKAMLVLESLNLFYVALTRAKEKLTVFVRRKDLNKQKVSTWEDLILLCG